jgi:cytochrome bd-type quinol oxidase subunit 1
MKKFIHTVFAATLVAASLIALPVSAQNISKIKESARTAAAGIAVTSANGQTTVVYKGQEVWTGKTKNKPVGKTKVVGGKEYVAAFDGDKVIWENVPGAGQKVK